MNFQKTKIVLLLAAIVLFAACSEQKKLTKAKQRVLTDPETFNSVGATWAKLNPCIIDSVVKYTTNTVEKTDTFYKHGDFVYAPVDRDTIIVHRNINHYDTARVYIRDLRYENTLKDTVNQYKIVGSKYQTAFEVSKATANKYLKFAILFLVLLIAENIVIILYKAKTL